MRLSTALFQHPTNPNKHIIINSFMYAANIAKWSKYKRLTEWTNESIDAETVLFEQRQLNNEMERAYKMYGQTEKPEKLLDKSGPYEVQSYREETEKEQEVVGILNIDKSNNLSKRSRRYKTRESDATTED